MEELNVFLQEEYPTVDFARTDLIDSGALDSITLVSLIASLEEKYGIEITMDYIVPENFNSTQAMWDMIEELS